MTAVSQERHRQSPRQEDSWPGDGRRRFSSRHSSLPPPLPFSLSLLTTPIQCAALAVSREMCGSVCAVEGGGWVAVVMVVVRQSSGAWSAMRVCSVSSFQWSLPLSVSLSLSFSHSSLLLLLLLLVFCLRCGCGHLRVRQRAGNRERAGGRRR